MRQNRNGTLEEREVLSLLSHERKPLERRDDAATDCREVIDLPVPAAASRAPHGAARERLTDEIERSSIDLRDVEGR